MTKKPKDSGLEIGFGAKLLERIIVIKLTQAHFRAFNFSNLI